MADENLPLPVPRGTNEGLVLDNTMLRIDKGRVAPPSDADQEPRPPRVEHIPWGYGRDLIKAMVVDPNRLYLYWEVTDPAIAKARQGLGAGGKDAWLSLRIYDTDRSHLRRNERTRLHRHQGRAIRSAMVRSHRQAGFHARDRDRLEVARRLFRQIARSGRADFPRFEPSSDGTVDWLSVRTSTGPVGDPSRGSARGAGWRAAANGAGRWTWWPGAAGAGISGRAVCESKIGKSKPPKVRFT